MTDTPTPFAAAADRLQAARPGVTDAALAELLGVHPTTASYYRTGQRTDARRGGAQSVEAPAAVLAAVQMWADHPLLFDEALVRQEKK